MPGPVINPMWGHMLGNCVILIVSVIRRPSAEPHQPGCNGHGGVMRSDGQAESGTGKVNKGLSSIAGRITETTRKDNCVIVLTNYATFQITGTNFCQFRLKSICSQCPLET